MKDNPLIRYAEQLAVDIESLCKLLERKDNSNTIFQIRKSSSSVFANISEAQYLTTQLMKKLSKNIEIFAVGYKGS